MGTRGGKTWLGCHRMSWLKWSGGIPSPSAGTKDALCLSLNTGQPFLPLEQSDRLSSAGSTCFHISFHGIFSNSWKLGKCSDEMLVFIMKASFRCLCFRACARSLFLFCNPVSSTPFSKQQLTIRSMWNLLTPGSLISKRVLHVLYHGWRAGGAGFGFFW